MHLHQQSIGTLITKMSVLKKGVDVQMVELRFSVLKETVHEMFQFLREGGQVGILDGSNLSHSFRDYLMKQMESEV